MGGAHRHGLAQLALEEVVHESISTGHRGVELFLPWSEERVSE